MNISAFNVFSENQLAMFKSDTACLHKNDWTLQSRTWNFI